jgi:hypothetical protein
MFYVEASHQGYLQSPDAMHCKRGMNNGRTVFSPLVESLPHQQFQNCAYQYGGGRYRGLDGFTLLIDLAVSGRNPPPRYLGLKQCRCSILIIVRSAQEIAPE